jgi:Leucine-rich repeat (LRR) protein
MGNPPEGKPTKTTISVHGITALAKSSHFNKLEVLNLSGNPIGDAGAIALAKSRYLGNLNSLDLDDCGITRVGAEAIALSDQLSSLAQISLGGHQNEIDDRAATALAKSPHLKHLTLFMNSHLTDAGKKLLRKRFGSQPMTGYDE